MKSRIARLLRLTLCCALLLSLGLPAQVLAAEEQTVRGVGAGRNGDITVDVLIADETIKDIVIISHSETPGISDPAFDKLPKSIIEANSLSVDTVSGATLTSNGIIKAVENALTQANIPVLSASPETAETRNTGTKADYADILSYLMGNEKAIAPNEYYEGLAWIGGMFDH